MGGHFTSALWTYWFLLCSVKSVFSDELNFLQELGSEHYPQVSKINISQHEYTKMTNFYLEQLRNSQEPESIPKLLTFNAVSERIPRRRREHVTRLRFSVQAMDDVSVENAELRLLIPTLPRSEHMAIKVYQYVSPKIKKVLDERVVYIPESGPKWAEFDVSSAVSEWVSGGHNLGLGIECEDCDVDLRPVQAYVNALIHPVSSGRRKRNVHELGGRTDCPNSRNNKTKCCRRDMRVTFDKLDLKLTVVQPKGYDAFYCKGRCPLNYNHATNHSRIQNLVHKMNRKATPRACCAPSKLKHLEILRVHPNGNQLIVETWDNMVVLECACS